MSEATGMNHWIDPNGILHVMFDRPDDKVNLLTPELLRDLARSSIPFGATRKSGE